MMHQDSLEPAAIRFTLPCSLVKKHFNSLLSLASLKLNPRPDTITQLPVIIIIIIAEL